MWGIRSWVVAGLVAVAFSTAGCKKSEGGTCYEATDCAEGLACLGENLRRCEKCDADDICTNNGQCSAKEGLCIAAADAECKKAVICTESGGCTAKDGKCVVGGDADCKQSVACAKQGFCKAKGNNCIKP